MRTSCESSRHLNACVGPVSRSKDNLLGRHGKSVGYRTACIGGIWEIAIAEDVGNVESDDDDEIAVLS